MDHEQEQNYKDTMSVHQLLNFFTWQWNWVTMCGPLGLIPWDPLTEDLGLCFQQICLQLPIFAMLATASSYYFGLNCNWVIRDRRQIRTINIRSFIVLLLAIMPLVHLFWRMTRSTVVIHPVTVLLACSESLTWIVHMGACLASRGKGDTTARGPLTLRVLWTLTFVLSIVWLRSNLLTTDFAWAVAGVVLHSLYTATMIPGGHSRPSIAPPEDDRERDDERQALLGPYNGFREELDPYALGRAADGASVFSKMSFYWVGTLIQKGVDGKVRNTDDLFDLPSNICCERISDDIEEKLSTRPSLLRSLHSLFGIEFYSIGLLRLLGDLSGFGGPLLLGGLLGAAAGSGSAMDAYFYAAGLLGTTLLGAFCTAHFNFRMSVVGLRIRTAIVSTVYRKILGVRNGAIAAEGQALNYMSTDTERIVNSCPSFHAFWSIPFQLFATLYLLYAQLGLAFLGGVGVAVGLMPINKYIAGRIGSLSTGLLKSKDARVGATGELLRGIRAIKLFAWEDVFIDKIVALRLTELSYLRKRKYLDALCVVFWACTPVMVSVTSFTLYVLLGNTLDARTVFTSSALLAMLIGPLNAFPWVLNGLVEAWVSLKRVQKLVDTPDLNLHDYYEVLDNNYYAAIVMQNASFTFPINKNGADNPIIDLRAPGLLSIQTDGTFVEHKQFALRDINLHIKKGELVGVIGPVGSGKSALLEAILANMNKHSGDISIDCIEEGFGYVAQTPWLQRGSVRENILFGKGYDEARYTAVIEACALGGDLVALGGDHIGVGEAGATLSGGQKARVALARAVYQDKPVYLMDDILSALDGSVAGHVVRHCILGLLQYKTRIVVTSHRGLLLNCDTILQMADGRITSSGPLEVLSDLESTDKDNNGDTKKSKLVASDSKAYIRDDDTLSINSIMEEEALERGILDSNVVWAYWQAAGALLGCTVILSVILMQASRNLSDVWLAHWVSNSNISAANTTNSSDRIQKNTFNLGNSTVFLEDTDKLLSGNNSVSYTIANFPVILERGSFNDLDNGTSVSFYLTIYASLAGVNAVCTLFRAFLFAYAGVKAAKIVHQKLLESIIFAKVWFFDINPLGRILNRFSSDTYTIDDTLPFILNILLAQLAGLIGSLAISLYAMPWLGLLVAPLIPMYHSLQGRYRMASREIKRLSSRSMSPLYNLFTETLQGRSTIRSMRAGPRFRRDFMLRLEDSLKTQLCSAATSQWLGLRLQILGAILVGGAGFLAAIQTQYGVAQPALVGLAISYALSLMGLLAGLVNAFTETEQELVAVERVLQYSKAPPEHTEESMSPPYAWPAQGVVRFNNVTMKYRENLSPSLKDVTFETRICERLGIVGRTGAGKSSLISALFRTAQITDGQVYIDTVNVVLLSLKELRSRIAVVPQDPFLFSGTLRNNLDPRNNHSDVDIWAALGKCSARQLARDLGGLEGELTSGGVNLSAGQRQLLCLARAVLQNAKIVCIDEATANIDPETDILIQRTLCSAFRSSTVIIIAHRLKGLKDADRILVMDLGRVIECGDPKTLLNDDKSAFKRMMDEETDIE